ncbi:MAG TPA: RagB/SusD family nutrient uptake outer membrane protein [Flavilitoribacter sp.]|nr:RagB/SusD family nutrient uptake outer membrane protein [Flavilitoribacter sp.]HMQ90814.1 RagB/SusD family nutrient uptake outer membrane protein [Flavilitoribacter sp.]
MRKLSIILIVIMALGWTSCDKQLDISPRQSIETGKVFTNGTNLEAALAGAYSEIKGTFNGPFGGELYGGDFNLFSELLASDGNVIWGGSFSTYRQLYNKSVITTNVLIANDWIRAYNAINNLNNVLAHLDVADDQDQADRVQGEALALRSMIYFELVRLWSRPWGTGTEATDPGVPLVLSAVNTVEDAEKLGLIGRSTVKDVYDQVIADLVKAETLLENAGTNGSSISTYAVSAILSRVYLQQGEFAKAAQSADRVIQSGEYSLNANPLRAFNSPSNSSEDVFAIQQTALSNAGTSNGGLATFYARLNGSGRGDMQVQEAFFDLFEPGDRRGQLEEDLPSTATIANVNEMYYIGVGGQNAGNIQCAKYGDGNLNIQVIRLAELYLNRAEANFEAGTSVGASPLSDINTIRERAGLAPLLIVTRQDIHDERQRELAFEGFRLHDKKRWKEDVEDLPYDSPKLVLPIPERELEVYDIEQNPGYE